MWTFFARWTANRILARSDAERIVADHGQKAYAIVREMARAARSGRFIDSSRPRGHWDRVRREIERMQKRT